MAKEIGHEAWIENKKFKENVKSLNTRSKSYAKAMAMSKKKNCKCGKKPCEC